MRIFLTGATGFVGSHFINLAHAAGHEVVALRRTREALPRVAAVREPTWLTRALGEVTEQDLVEVDVLMHLAAAGTTAGSSNWDELLEANVVAPAKLTLTAARAGVNQIVVAGSCLEYGHAAARYEFIPPNAPLEPSGPYAASKAAGGVLLRTMAEQHKLRFTYARLFSVYGVGQHERNLWPMIRRAALAGEDLPLTPGEQLRDFISVEQVAQQLLALAAAQNVEPGVPHVCNLGTGLPQSVRQFAEHWWREFGARGNLLFGSLAYRNDEVMRYVAQV